MHLLEPNFWQDYESEDFRSTLETTGGKDDLFYQRNLSTELSEGEIVLEHQGIGFAIFIPGSFMQELPSIGEELTVYTYLNVREDAMQLFGFFDAGRSLKS